MKIEDLIQLLDNRLREFKLSRDYAKMNGDLERVNSADKEVISLEDTLFKLNLLVDTSKSAAVKEKVLAEVILDGSTAVLGEYDITRYATDPLHERKIMNILSKMGVMDTVEKIDDYIKGKYPISPITGEMIMSASLAYGVDARLMMAIIEQDSSFATAGKAVRTLNPGNVGNDDSGNLRTYDSWQEGVTAVAEWLSRHRGSTIIPETLEETVVDEPITTTASTSATASSSFSLTPSDTTSTIASSSEETLSTTASSSDATVTPSPTPTPAPTPTPTPSSTPEPTPEPTPTPDPTPEPTPEPTPTPTPSSTPEPTPEPTPTPTPTPEPTPTPDPSPSPTPEATATEAEPTPTPTTN